MLYKANKEGICPKCGKEDLYYSKMVFDNGLAYFPYYCKNCNQVGEEFYSMDFIGHDVIDIFGNNVTITEDMLEKRG